LYGGGARRDCRPVVNDRELAAMQRLASQVWAIDPTHVASDASFGTVTWTWVVTRGGERLHRVWEVGQDAVAWGWIFLGEMIRVRADLLVPSEPSLIWQVHPAWPALADEVLAWFEVEVGGAGRQTAARAVDDAAIGALRRHGYAEVKDAPWSLLNVRSLSSIEAPTVPPGYAVTTMQSVRDVSSRAAVHRAAWEPSSVTESRYIELMDTWPYRDDLDVVVVAPDGSLAASANLWIDERNRTAEFEPVGVDPFHRQLGLGRAVVLAGIELAREAGCDQVVVGCRGDDNYPVPRRLYASVGFQELTRDVPFRAG
jgi:GNAT superfamily N-acetyltransferase